MMEARRHIEPHQPVFVLVGCKLDLAETGARQVSTEEAKAFSEQNDVITVETSAKTGQHVEEAFTAITQEVRDIGALVFFVYGLFLGGLS